MSTDNKHTLEEVVLFLRGIGELRGVTFGLQPEGETAPYWWRSILRNAVTEQAEENRKLKEELSAKDTLITELVEFLTQTFFEGDPKAETMYEEAKKFLRAKERDRLIHIIFKATKQKQP